MEIVGFSDVNLDSLVTALLDGKIIVYPTETCYGLGCDATNAEAVERIYEIKGRESGKPLIALVSDLSAIETYIERTPLLDKIAREYWPGPLTVVVPAKKGVKLPMGVVGGDGAIALRVTSHPMASALARALGRPLVSTSANLSGGENLYAAEDVVRAFAGRPREPDIVIDAGTLPHRPPSTVARLADDKIEIIRQGDTQFLPPYQPPPAPPFQGGE